MVMLRWSCSTSSYAWTCLCEYDIFVMCDDMTAAGHATNRLVTIIGVGIALGPARHSWLQQLWS